MTDPDKNHRVQAQVERMKKRTKELNAKRERRRWMWTAVGAAAIVLVGIVGLRWGSSVFS
jgi:hypothetical protein